MPKVLRETTTTRVLTMEHSPGHRMDWANTPLSRPQTARTLMRLFPTQVFEHGVFHADPHPGNVFLLPDGRMCFHDFGALGQLPHGVGGRGKSSAIRRSSFADCLVGWKRANRCSISGTRAAIRWSGICSMPATGSHSH